MIDLIELDKKFVKKKQKQKQNENENENKDELDNDEDAKKYKSVVKRLSRSFHNEKADLNSEELIQIRSDV